MNVLSSERYTVCCIIEGEHSSSHWCIKHATSVCLRRDSSRCSPKTGAASSALCRSNREVRETSTTSPCSAGRWLSLSSTSCPHPWFVTSLCRFFPTLPTDCLSATKRAGWSPTLDVGRLGGDENRSVRWKQPDHVSYLLFVSVGLFFSEFCTEYKSYRIHLDSQDWFTQKNRSKPVSIVWQLNNERALTTNGVMIQDRSRIFWPKQKWSLKLFEGEDLQTVLAEKHYREWIIYHEHWLVVANV